MMLECCGSPVTDSPTSSAGYPSGQGQSPPMSTLLTMNLQENARHSQSAFVLSNPPLAALHNMTEMKVPPAAMLSQQSAYAYSQSGMKTLGAGIPSTPHSIQDILNRANCVNNGLGLSQFGVPRLNAAGLNGNMYFNSAAMRFPKPLTDLPGRTLYWPGMLQQTWRPAGNGTFYRE